MFAVSVRELMKEMAQPQPFLRLFFHSTTPTCYRFCQKLELAKPGHTYK
jgi:hypothetical protein